LEGFYCPWFLGILVIVFSIQTNPLIIVLFGLGTTAYMWYSYPRQMLIYAIVMGVVGFILLKVLSAGVTSGGWFI